MANAGELESNWKGIPIPFAKNATYGGGNSSLPLDEIAGSNKASWKKGFPETTFQPNNAPSGGDFNTLPNIITGLLMNLQLGQAVNVYDAAYQTAQGGYPQGALIWANETSGDYTTRALFMSLVDNNLTVPSAANTATWKKLLPADTLYPIRAYMGKTTPAVGQLIDWSHPVNGNLNWRKQNSNYVCDFNPNGYWTNTFMPLTNSFLDYDEIIFIYDTFGADSPDIAMRSFPTWKFNLLMSMPKCASVSIGGAVESRPLIYSYAGYGGNKSYSNFLWHYTSYGAATLAILGVTYV